MLMMGAIMGSDVRIIAPRELWPSQEIRDAATQRAAESGATITITADPQAGLPGARFVHTDVWVSMGESEDAWETRIEQLTPYRIDAQFLELTERPDVRFMHCLPAYHDTKTKIGQLVSEKFGLSDGVEVTHEVFESPASIVFEQAENRMHTIKALMVATLS
jgi:ornithine carbamoyltransferase